MLSAFKAILFNVFPLCYYFVWPLQVGKIYAIPLKKAYIVMLVTVVLCADAAMGECLSYSFFLSNCLFHFRVTGSVSVRAVGFFVCVCSAAG